eukprot:tig00000498_g1632.t1
MRLRFGTPSTVPAAPPPPAAAAPAPKVAAPSVVAALAGKAAAAPPPPPPPPPPAPAAVEQNSLKAFAAYMAALSKQPAPAPAPKKEEEEKEEEPKEAAEEKADAAAGEEDAEEDAAGEEAADEEAEGGAGKEEEGEEEGGEEEAEAEAEEGEGAAEEEEVDGGAEVPAPAPAPVAVAAAVAPANAFVYPPNPPPIVVANPSPAPPPPRLPRRPPPGAQRHRAAAAAAGCCAGPAAAAARRAGAEGEEEAAEPEPEEAEEAEAEEAEAEAEEEGAVEIPSLPSLESLDAEEAFAMADVDPADGHLSKDEFTTLANALRHSGPAVAPEEPEAEGGSLARELGPGPLDGVPGAGEASRGVEITGAGGEGPAVLSFSEMSITYQLPKFCGVHPGGIALDFEHINHNINVAKAVAAITPEASDDAVGRFITPMTPADFEAIDANHDALIDYPELAGHLAPSVFSRWAPESGELIDRLAAKAGLARPGSAVTYADIERAFAPPGTGPFPAAADQLDLFINAAPPLGPGPMPRADFDEADTDNDGKLTHEEYYAFALREISGADEDYDEEAEEAAAAVASAAENLPAASDAPAPASGAAEEAAGAPEEEEEGGADAAFADDGFSYL